MTSSKKKRGKQRKAAKAAATSNEVGSGGDRINALARGEIAPPQSYAEVINILNGLPHKTIVEMIQNGDNISTCALANSYVEGLSLESSGILSIVLDFLKRCEHETFDEVTCTFPYQILILATPSSWINVVLMAYLREKTCRVQIAQNIGPLVRCMCADTKRFFFKSRKHWGEAIRPFVKLIYNMLYVLTNERNIMIGENMVVTEGSQEKKKIVETLLKHEGLLASIVQWGFWGEHRPDIKQMLGEEECGLIVDWGRYSVLILVDELGDIWAGDGKRILEIIATTPIVSKDHNPNCMVSYMAGLICLMKTNGDEYLSSNILRILVERVDCVDKGVISEMVDFGLNFTADYDGASFVASYQFWMLFHETDAKKGLPSDGRVAFAIRVGVIEMCLGFVQRFGAHELFDEHGYSLFQIIGCILVTIHEVSLHKKSAKAIRSKKKEIKRELMRLEENTDIRNNASCKELSDMVRSILDINGAYCCRCNKPLGRKGMKRCNGCNCMTYCSRACQREDWLSGGHNTTCSMPASTNEQGRFQGRMWPETLPESERAGAKLEALEVNMTMIQLKLFLDNTDTIQRQATSLGIPLHDCAVLFDLSKCPLTVKVQRYTDFYNSPGLKKAFEGSRSKKNSILCVYYSYICNGHTDESGHKLHIAMQRLFPCEWVCKQQRM